MHAPDHAGPGQIRPLGHVLRLAGLACALASASAIQAQERTTISPTLSANPGRPAEAAPTLASTTPSLEPIVVQGASGGSLIVPTAREAATRLGRIAGGAEVVAHDAWRDTQAATVKDILDYTPGVFAQPKWGEDARLSIRGSGLSRYYHLRGIALYQDGVPLGNADGSADFQWIDPTAYRYAEVYKGANALRYGAGTLGGAINFVTPTGHDTDRLQGRADVGGFGWRRLQASTGFAEQAWDGFLTASGQGQDGYREHSGGHSLRASGNLGWRLAERTETRFYLTAGRIRQEIPGSLTREQALNEPRSAAPANIANDWRRDVDGVRLANRTLHVAGPASYEAGAWYSHTDLDHPIYQYLRNRYQDYGVYARLRHDGSLAGHGNRLTLGLTWSGGRVDANNYVNQGGRKGARLSKTDDRAHNLAIYGENALEVLPNLSLIAGLQYLRATRKRTDLYNAGEPPLRSGSRDYVFVNPRVGMLWQLRPDWQVFGNVSRSGEAPTFGDMDFSTANDLDRLQPQRATTYELGSRGDAGHVAWDVSVYHARLRHEFQCVSTPWNICDQVRNLDRTIHQGIEAGVQWTLLRGVFEPRHRGDNLWLNAAYTFSDFRFDDDERWGDNRIPGVPRHYLRVELLYRHTADFYIGPNVEWVPQAYYVDNANSVKTASYALLGLRAGWESGRYGVYLEARNLTDKAYIASANVTDQAHAGSALFEPGTGRAIFAGLRIQY
ncbi:MAG: TonB-dependent receptor [Pigmentiphaga sp.]|nr:TonB-dependent receptor [Pigmentiphaga sp.]